MPNPNQKGLTQPEQQKFDLTQPRTNKIFPGPITTYDSDNKAFSQ